MTGTGASAGPAWPSTPAPLGPGQALAWVAELLRVPAGLVRSYVPGAAGIDARTRQQLIVAVSESNGVRSAAWVHGAWLDFVGRREADVALAPLFDYAHACSRAGVPVDTTTLDAVFPPSVVGSVRATVAVAQIGSAAAAPAEGMWARVRGHGTGSRLAAAGQAVALGLSLPLLAPAVGVAGTMKFLTRLAPELPPIELTPAGADANLVAHLLAAAAPAYLGHALARAGVVLSPVPVAVAFRMDGTSATIRVGRGRVSISNGVEPEAVAIVDGGVESLVQLVTGSILRDMGVPVRRWS